MAINTAVVEVGVCGACEHVLSLSAGGVGGADRLDLDALEPASPPQLSKAVDVPQSKVDVLPDGLPGLICRLVAGGVFQLQEDRAKVGRVRSKIFDLRGEETFRVHPRC